MLKYSELSKPQKDLLDTMRQGHELIQRNGFYRIGDGRFVWNVRCNTVSALLKRNFIKECFNKDGLKVFCVNVEISY
jgi:hypothetical protein